MPRLKKLAYLAVHRRIKAIILLTILFSVSLILLLFSGGAVNYVLKGNEYSQRFSVYDGYYVADFTSPDQTEIELIGSMEGIERVLYATTPLGIELDRDWADRLTGVQFEVYSKDIVHTIEMPFVSELAADPAPLADEIQLIVSEQVPLNVGDSIPIRLSDGRSMRGVVVSSYSASVPYLSFTNWSSEMSFSYLLNLEPRILFWRDANGLCENQKKAYDPRPTGNGFLMLMDEGIQPESRRDLLTRIQGMQYVPQSLEQIGVNTLRERQQIVKKEMAIPIYLVIISAIYILSSAFITESRYSYRMAIYRLNGLTIPELVVMSTFPVFVSGLISFFAVSAYSIFLAEGGPQSFIMRNHILIDGPLYWIGAVFVVFLTTLSLLLNWSFIRKSSISEKIRKGKE